MFHYEALTSKTKAAAICQFFCIYISLICVHLINQPEFLAAYPTTKVAAIYNLLKVVNKNEVTLSTLGNICQKPRIKHSLDIPFHKGLETLDVHFMDTWKSRPNVAPKEAFKFMHYFIGNES